MRIESVTAHAFGPLSGETLELAPGMTVIVGDNESAKSTWHAAIYSALCGRRRGKGQPTKEDRYFEELHRPWDGAQWLVSAVVVLDDGRRIELWQDLGGKVDCRATDLALGREVSSEVVHEGAPDAARWLGLDRRTFVATACVYQAQLLHVLDGASGLQSHLERAAATAGADATATEALARLEAFRAEHVGRDDARSIRPLRRATTHLYEARLALEEARCAHTRYLQALEEADHLREEADAHERHVALCEAAAARKLADDLRTRYGRVVTLERSVGGVAPPRALGADALSTTVARALGARRSCPELPALDGPFAAEIEAQIHELPPMPDGPLAVAPQTQHAYDQLLHSEQLLEAHDATRPMPPAPSAPGAPCPGASLPAAPVPGPSAAELLELAQALDEPPPTADPAVADRVRIVTERLRLLDSAHRRSIALLWVGSLLVVAGALGATLGPRSSGALALLGLVLIATGALSHNRRTRAVAQAELSELHAHEARARERVSRITVARERAEARCGELEIAPVPSSLRALVDQLAHHDAYEEQLRTWGHRRTVLVSACEDAAARLRSALVDAGDPVDEDVLVSYAVHEERCRARAEVAGEARRLPGLQAQLRERRRVEELAARAASACRAADDQVLEAAHACGLAPGSPDEAAAALGAWEQHRRGDLEQLDTRQRQWAEREALLGGRSVEELAEALATAEDDARARAADFEAGEITTLAGQDLASRLPALREKAAVARTAAAAAEGASGEQAKTLPSVAGAEETLAAAEVELARVQELDETLMAASELLTRAQEGVQRDVAPLLAATLRSWLPKITAGRYVDAAVDPTTLEVKVCGADRRWRRADRLSHGTAEQVYLLLRVTLSRHLTGESRACPLLLDDVTVQADAARTTEILELLHELSAEQQIVVFAQERIVAQWAERHLLGPADAILELSVVSAV
ncbi:MAG: AAA family ATPase [Actinomycetota bacterium]|nr:AAA family ATPase [Actinomycetota bacterium]MDA8075412.1 AAA family ATPase [Actinomycetota bacterium]